MTNEEFQAAWETVKMAFNDGLVQRWWNDHGWCPAAPMSVLHDKYRIKPKPREVFLVEIPHGVGIKYSYAYPSQSRADQAIAEEYICIPSRVVKFREVIDE